MELHWKKSLSEQARRLHIHATYSIGIGFLAFSGSDYMSFPELWPRLVSLRFIIAGLMALTAGLVHFKKIQPIVLGYVNVLPISFFLTYLLTIAEIKGINSINFSFFIFYAATSFGLLWHWKHSIFLAFIGAPVQLWVAWQFVGMAEFVPNSGTWTLITPFLVVFMVAFRYNITKKEFFLRYQLEEKNTELEQQTEEIRQQSETLQAQSHELRQSNDETVFQKNAWEKLYTETQQGLRYAQRIQRALLPPLEDLQADFKDVFVFYRPRDIVSGDFYWTAEEGKFRFIVAADCTGHGVSGAFLTLIGHNLLNQIIKVEGCINPAEILAELNQRLIQTLQNQDRNKRQLADGMDIALIRYDREASTLTFSGAKCPLLHLNSEALPELYKGDRLSIGGNKKREKVFRETEIPVEKNDVIYLFSDGYADQFNNKLNKRIMSRNFREMLGDMHLKPFEQQKKLLEGTFIHWKGKTRQTDDILVLGIRI